MTDNAKIARQMFDACMNKDFESAKKLLHPQYTLKDPMMKINGPDEMIEMMKNCPFESGMEDIKIVADGDTVVSTFTMTSPNGPPLRMCSVARMENGQFRSEEMFYDTAQIPQEMKDAARQNMPQGDKRAA